MAKSKTLRGSAPPQDDFIPLRSKSILARKNLDGTIAILHLDNDEYFYTIDGIAAELWNLIDGKSSLGKLKAKLVKRHQPPVALLEREVSRFIEKLQKEELIELSRAAR